MTPKLPRPLLDQVAPALASVAADGAYDRTNVYQAFRAHSPDVQINIPPRRDAKIQQHGNSHWPPLPRDENLRQIRQHGRAHWQRRLAQELARLMTAGTSDTAAAP